MPVTPAVAPSEDITDRLAAVADRRPRVRAVVCPSRTPGRAPREITFGELHGEVLVLARGLMALGIGPGTRVVLLVRPGPDMVALAFALLRVGAVPVLVDPGLGRERLKAALAHSRPAAFIASPAAHVARIVLGWGRGSVKQTVSTGRFGSFTTLAKLRTLGTAGPEELPQLDPNGPALVAFTSGSTGVPKGVELSRDQLGVGLDVISATFGWGSVGVDVPTLPLFALLGVAAGRTAVLPDMDFTRPADVDPAMLADLLERYRATTMFGSPALVNTLTRWAEANRVTLSSLRELVCAGAPVSPELMRRTHRILPPGCRMSTPYGATEALPIAIIDSREVLDDTAALTDRGAGVCVGRPVAGAEVSIVALTDEAIDLWDESLLVEPGVHGEICVRAPWVSRRYLDDDANTALNKIGHPSGDVVHRTGDVGWLDDEGRIWFCGRKRQRVDLPGQTLFTVPCESIFNAHPAVYRSALVGPCVRGAVRPTICVELQPEAEAHMWAQLRNELLALGAAHRHTRVIRDVLLHPGFPTDVRHNAKIEREALRDWARKQLMR